MIDFHTHILPNIDDGARDIRETFELIKEAKRAGFDKIISTSHYMEGYYEINADERQVWLDAISKNLNSIDYDGTLYLGSEIYLSNNIMHLLEDGKASTINNTSYVLFELPLNAKPFDLYELIYQMQENKIVPILAHPERYSFTQKDPDIIYDLAQKGVLMQANFGSIMGQYGKRAQTLVIKMFQCNLVHFLGSDVHRPGTVYPRISQCLYQISEIVGDEKLKELTTINPNLALANKRIDVESPSRIHYNFTEKMLMKF